MSEKVPNPNTNADFDTSLHITKSTKNNSAKNKNKP